MNPSDHPKVFFSRVAQAKITKVEVEPFGWDGAREIHGRNDGWRAWG
jgi:hypothetical protein